MTDHSKRRSSPPPTRPLSLAIPIPTVPLDKIPSLIPYGTMMHHILPKSGFAFNVAVDPSPSDSPRWSVWLESHYRSFCPAVWPLLEADDKADAAVVGRLSAYRRVRREQGADIEELDRLRLDEKELQQRRLTRHVKLYGLHAARQRYLDYCLNGSPPLFVAEGAALLAAEPGEARQFAKYASGQVWPLRVKHDSHADCRCHIFVSELGNLSSLVVPDVQTDTSRRIGFQLWGEDPHDPNAAFRQAGCEAKEGTKGQTRASGLGPSILPFTTGVDRHRRLLKYLKIALSCVMDKPQAPSSPPARPLNFTIPTPTVPLDKIPALVTFSLAVIYTLPNSGFAFAVDLRESPTDPPRWPVWLESHYRSFCPAVWPLLEADEDKDREVVDSMLEYRERREEEGAADAELDALARDAKMLEERRLARYSLYGLHATRRRYLNYCLLGSPPLFRSEGDALLAGEPGEASSFSRYPPGSVWPLFTPHETHSTCRCVYFATPELVPALTLPYPPSDFALQLGLQICGEDPSDPDSDFRRAARLSEADNGSGRGARRTNEALGAGDGLLAAAARWAGSWLGGSRGESSFLAGDEGDKEKGR
ncbi:hypothetical protein JCM10207_006403 [Rhodosporidiobolus poonsookiae]